MQWKNTLSGFGFISVTLHWISALAFYCLFALGLWMVTLGYYDDWYHQAPEVHKSIGAILFAIMLFRVLWRFISPAPPPLATHSKTTLLAAKLAQAVLYLGLFVLLISGYLISTAEGQAISVFGWFSIPATLSGIQGQADTAGTVHLYLAWFLVLLSAMHGLAALKHHFIDRDATLKRMLTPRGD